MRKTYKFSHSVRQGGYLYAHKTLNKQTIENKYGLKNALLALSKKYGLIDVTIKIYDSIFFMFFMQKPSLAPSELIQAIQTHIPQFAQWDKEYIYSAVYDLQEQHVRKDLARFGFNYDKGF